MMANSKPSVSIGSACCQPSGVPALERAVGADRTKGGAPALAVGQSVAAVGAPPALIQPAHTDVCALDGSTSCIVE